MPVVSRPLSLVFGMGMCLEFGIGNENVLVFFTAIQSGIDVECLGMFWDFFENVLGICWECLRNLLGICREFTYTSGIQRFRSVPRPKHDART